MGFNKNHFRLTLRLSVGCVLAAVFLGLFGCSNDNPVGNSYTTEEDAPYYTVYGYVLGSSSNEPYEGYTIKCRCLDHQTDLGTASIPSDENGFYQVYIGQSMWVAHSGDLCRCLEAGGDGESVAFYLTGGGPTHYLGPIYVYIAE